MQAETEDCCGKRLQVRHVPRHVPNTWERSVAGVCSLVGGSVEELCASGNRDCCETASEARAAARAQYLEENRSGSVFTSWWKRRGVVCQSF